MENVLFGGGNSSLQLARTGKGDYTWEMKFYFLGNDMRAIKQVIANILKTRAILEASLDQEVIPTEKMSNYMQSLTAQVRKTVSSENAADALRGNGQKEGE